MPDWHDIDVGPGLFPHLLCEPHGFNKLTCPGCNPVKKVKPYWNCFDCKWLGACELTEIGNRDGCMYYVQLPKILPRVAK